VEDTVPPGSSAYYRLIVQTAKGTTAPGNVSSTPVSAITPVANNPALSATAVEVKEDDGIFPTSGATGFDTSDVDILFEVTDTRPEHTYSIYRQTVGDINGLGTTATGDYELVPGLSVNFGPAIGPVVAAGTIDGTVKLQYHPTAQRQQYNYQLRAYIDGVQVGADTDTVAAKDAVTLGTVDTSIGAFGPANNQTRWYGVLLSGITSGVPASKQLMEEETVYIYGRLDPNHPAPTAPDQDQPVESTTLIGDSAATYYDGSTEHPYPSYPAGDLSAGETGPSQPGYWIRASAYYVYSGSTITAEVK
jgi:hypothetical protein